MPYWEPRPWRNLAPPSPLGQTAWTPEYWGKPSTGLSGLMDQWLRAVLQGLSFTLAQCYMDSVLYWLSVTWTQFYIGSVLHGLSFTLSQCYMDSVLYWLSVTWAQFYIDSVLHGLSFILTQCYMDSVTLAQRYIDSETQSLSNSLCLWLIVSCFCDSLTLWLSDYVTECLSVSVTE